MTASRILDIVALVLAILAVVPFSAPFPILAVAVICLAIARIV